MKVRLSYCKSFQRLAVQQSITALFQPSINALAKDNKKKGKDINLYPQPFQLQELVSNRYETTLGQCEVCLP